MAPGLLAGLAATPQPLQVLVAATLRGTVILIVAVLLCQVLRRRTAASRHLVLSLALAGLLALPALARVLPAWEVPVLPPAAHAADHGAPVPGHREHGPGSTRPSGAGQTKGPRVAGPAATGPTGLAGASRRSGSSGLDVPAPPAAAPAGAPAASPSGPRMSPHLAFLAIWLGGAGLLLARLAVGLAGAWWLGRRARPATDPGVRAEVHRIRRRLGLRRQVRVLVSDDAHVPMTWGVVRPVVLLPSSASAWSPERLRVVLGHELAHVERRDCLTHLVARFAAAIHWINPLVWLAVCRHRFEQERACDDRVLALGTRASEYADHLLAIARESRRRSVAGGVALGMARRSRLDGRVVAILDPRLTRSPLTWRTTMTAHTLCLALLVPLAALQPAPATAAHDGLDAAAPPMPAAPPLDDVVPSGAPAPAPPAPQAMPDLDDLVRMRIHGVTPEFVTAVRQSLGSGVDVETIVKLRIHGASADYIERLQGLFGDGLDADDVVRARIHGVSPEYVESLRERVDETLGLDEIVRLRIHGVDPDDAADLADAGLGDLDAAQLVRLRNHGVGADLVRALGELGYTDLAVDDVVRLRNHGVSPAFISRMEAAGLAGVDLDQLVRLRSHGVSPEYVAALRDMGHGGDVDDLVRLRNHGVSVEYLTGLRDLGYADIELSDAVRLRSHGVSLELVRDLREAGYDDLTVDELVEIRDRGMARFLLRRGGGR